MTGQLFTSIVLILFIASTCLLVWFLCRIHREYEDMFPIHQMTFSDWTHHYIQSNEIAMFAFTAFVFMVTSFILIVH